MLGQIRKRLLFTMIKNTDFLSSVNTNSFYSAATISVNVNGKQITNDGLSLGMGLSLGYRTLFETSGFQNSNSGLQIIHNMYINGYFVFLFFLTADRGDSEGHISHLDNGNIRL